MGNTLTSTKKTKIMKIDGTTFRLKLPAKAMDVLKDYTDTYVLLESESVKKYGVRAQELRPETELKPKKIYFLVELPKFPEEKQTLRRVRSDVHIGSAKERLDRLMLRQRSASVLGSSDGPVRVKLRVPKAEIDRLMEENRDEDEVAERILDLCLLDSGNGLKRFKD